MEFTYESLSEGLVNPLPPGIGGTGRSKWTGDDILMRVPFGITPPGAAKLGEYGGVCARFTIRKARGKRKVHLDYKDDVGSRRLFTGDADEVAAFFAAVL